GEPQMVQGLLPLFPEEAQPEKIVGDKAYDADWLDEVLAQLGIEMIAPHRSNRLPQNKTQDGRKLKSYKKRDCRTNAVLASEFSEGAGSL
ncbi:MAG: hypothetical protein J7L72_02255, partial [Candidatus Aminicenantes bacterium]|nr:hypothetical protein [Candidatus Aminicenantes bacterium]